MSNQETAPKLHWWQRKESIIAFAIIGTLVLSAVLILVAYTYHWDLTTTTTTEVTKSPQQKVTTTETGKTFLDWLQLVGVLAIPIVVAVGTAVFTTRQTRISEANRKQQHDTEMQIAENQQQEEFLRTYFDKISDLLLDEKQNGNQKIQSIVRARTLAALHILNSERKTIVLRFLHDSDFLPTSPTPTSLLPTSTEPTSAVPTSTEPTSSEPTSPMPTSPTPTSAVPTSAVLPSAVPT